MVTGKCRLIDVLGACGRRQRRQEDKDEHEPEVLSH